MAAQAVHSPTVEAPFSCNALCPGPSVTWHPAGQRELHSPGQREPVGPPQYLPIGSSKLQMIGYVSDFLET